MSEDLRRDRILRGAVVALLVLCVVGLGFEVYFERLDHQELCQIKKLLKPEHLLQAHDSPIEVAGGSIHALARGATATGNVWTQDQTNSDLYSAGALGGNGVVTVHGLVDRNGNSVGDKQNNDLQLTGTGGWEIVMYPNDYAPSSSKPNLMFCSAMSSSARCDWSNLGDNETVYVQAASDGHFESYKTDELHFHDRTTKNGSTCDTDNTEGPCDKISSIQIYTHTALSTGPYYCKNETDCCAVLGNTSITKCYQ